MSESSPAGWEFKNISDLVTLQYGKSPKDVICDDGEFPIIGTGGITGYASSYLFDGATTVIGRKGTINKPSFIDGKFWAIDTTYYGDKYRDADPKWFYYCLNSFDLAKYNEASGVPSLSRDTLNAIPLLTPPLPEQQKIAAILSTVDDVIEKTRAQIDKLKDLKTGMMQELLTKGIGHTEFKDSPVGRIPVGWDVVPISKIVEKVIDNRGKTPPISAGGYELLEVNSVRKDDVHPDYGKVSKYVDEETYGRWFRAGHPKSGDILIPTVGTIGSCSLMRENRGCIAQNLIALRIKQGVDTTFAYYVLSSHFTVRQIEAILMNAVQPSLRVPHFLMLNIVLPDRSEQCKIGEVLGAIDRKIACLQRKVDATKNLKKSLMQDLLTGAIRVKIS